MWDWLYRLIRLTAPPRGWMEQMDAAEPHVEHKFWCRGCRGLMNAEYAGLIDGAMEVFDHGYPAGLCQTHQRRTKMTADDILDIRQALEDSDDFLRGGLRPQEPEPVP